MNFLLDTNVVSEWVKPRPDVGVVNWLAKADEDQLFISVVTFAEIRLGVEGLPASTRRRRFESWLADDLPARFQGRILGIDMAVADAWGRVIAGRRAAGRPIEVMDACLAALAQTHALTLVTRNTKDFASLELQMFNPWEMSR